MKKFISIILATILIISGLPVSLTAHAESNEEVEADSFLNGYINQADYFDEHLYTADTIVKSANLTQFDYYMGLETASEYMKNYLQSRPMFINSYITWEKGKFVTDPEGTVESLVNKTPFYENLILKLIDATYEEKSFADVFNRKKIQTALKFRKKFVDKIDSILSVNYLMENKEFVDMGIKDKEAVQRFAKEFVKEAHYHIGDDFCNLTQEVLSGIDTFEKLYSTVGTYAAICEVEQSTINFLKKMKENTHNLYLITAIDDVIVMNENSLLGLIRESGFNILESVMSYGFKKLAEEWKKKLVSELYAGTLAGYLNVDPILIATQITMTLGNMAFSIDKKLDEYESMKCICEIEAAAEDAFRQQVASYVSTRGAANSFSDDEETEECAETLVSGLKILFNTYISDSEIYQDLIKICKKDWISLIDDETFDQKIAEEEQHRQAYIGVLDGILPKTSQCGANIYWYYCGGNTLYLVGYGEMYNYSQNTIPWYDYRQNIKTVYIHSAITKISDYSFANCSLENNVIFTGDISCGSNAFLGINPELEIIASNNLSLSGTHDILNDIRVRNNLAEYGNIAIHGNATVGNDLNTDYNGASNIVFCEGSSVSVCGNANLANTFVWGDKTLLIEQGASLSVGKNVSISGTQWNMKRFSMTNRGNLTVTGDFQTLGYSDFTMDRDNAYMLVLGTYANGASGITAGTVELKGNCSSIKTTGTGTVRISGYSKQTISGYDIANLIIENYSEEGAEFNTGTVRGKLKAVNAHIVNGKNICLCGGEFDGDTYSGEITIAGDTTITKDIIIEGNLYTDYNGTATITLSNNCNVNVLGNAYLSNNFVWGGKTLLIEPGSTLTVGADVYISGTSWNMQCFFVINRGSLIINGNLQALGYSSFTMDNDDAYLEVSGNNSYGIGLTAGTLALKGNCSNIKASGNSKVIISGNQPQTISNNSNFTTLIIDNTEGVSFNKPINVSVLFNHKGNPFTLYNNGNGSSFVDYDGDGLLDHIDPNPVVGNPCTLEFSANNDEYGSVSETRIETCGGTTINVSAAPRFKYCFLKWVDKNGNAVSNNANYTFVAKSDNHYTAVFEKRKRNISWDCENGWIVTPYEATIESEVSVSCYPYDGYVFEEGSLKYNDTPIESGAFIMPDEDVILTASFIRNENYFSLRSKIWEAEQYDGTYYTTNSFETLSSAIYEAQTALVNDISEEDSIAKIELLVQAINGLTERSTVSVSANNSQPEIYWNDADEINNEIFTVSYNNGTSEIVWLSDCEVSDYDATVLGVHTVTVTYEDVSTAWSINVVKRPIDTCLFGTIANQEYTGTAFTPEITVTFNGVRLVQGTDYTVTYRNNINAGTAYADVEGIGNFSGTKTCSFSIQPLYLYDDIVSTNILDYQFYNQETLIPDVKIHYNGKQLVEGIDYEVDCYSSEEYCYIDVYAHGIGNYDGWFHIDIRGDIDRDGCVSGRDLALLQKYLNSTPEERQNMWLSVGAADMNIDGDVNEMDVTALRDFLKTHGVYDDIHPEDIDYDSRIKKLSISSDVAPVGSIVSVPINITDNQGFNYLRLNFRYDESVLEFISAENGEVSDAIFSNNTNIVFWNTDIDVTTNGELTTLRFKVIQETDNYDILYKCSECFNSNQYYIEPELSAETTGHTLIGDVNLDGYVNINDVTAIQRCVAELDALLPDHHIFADTDGSGIVDIADATFLQMYLAEYDLKLG